MYSLLKKILPHKLKVFLNLFLNYASDLSKFWKFSTLNEINSLGNKESELILNYHSIEKGMLFPNIRPRFAAQRVINLHNYLNDQEIINNASKTQIFIAYKVMIEYFELHEKININISDYYTSGQYNNYKKIIKDIDLEYISGRICHNRYDFYKNLNNFYEFSYSRKSVRDFTGELIPLELIKKVIKLANTAPSVCNRQASKVYLLEDKELIDYSLKIQGGLTGYTDNINQILILTCNREYFYTIGERNQLYIDGGIYLMNLLYALHYYKIACCPANWGKTIQDEKRLAKKININDAEQIICMIPIGVATENFNVTLSYRRSVEEVLKVIPAHD